jgi:hypothetical protein
MADAFVFSFTHGDPFTEDSPVVQHEFSQMNITRHIEEDGR